MINILPTGTNHSPEQSFANAFTLPPEYLPKKKRAKLEKTGLPQPPAVRTCDKWWNVLQDKEEEKKTKQEKLAEKKALQEAKKKLAEEKKKLAEESKKTQNRMKDLAKRIKTEKELNTWTLSKRSSQSSLVSLA